MATTSSGTYTGTWAKKSSAPKLTLNITGAYILDEMTDDWLIIEMTASTIKLRDDNTEHLEELHMELQ